MNALERARFYANVLVQEGYQPQIDSAGDVCFKHEGGSYYISVDDDEQFFQLVFGGFWSIDSGEELARALIAMDETNRQCKVVKLCLRSDGKHVSAYAELFFGQVDHFKPVFRRTLRTMQYGVKTFREKMLSSA